MNTFEFFANLVYREECTDLPIGEAVEYIAERIRERYSNNRFVERFSTKRAVEMALFKGCYGEESVPVQIYMLNCGVYSSLDGVNPEEVEIFEKRWNSMFRR